MSFQVFFEETCSLETERKEVENILLQQMKTRKEKIEIKVREKFWRNTIKNNYALF